MKHYTVILRCVEGMFRIPAGRGMQMNFHDSRFGHFTLRVSTRTDTVKHIATPLPRELFIEVAGPAPNMETALNIAVATTDDYIRQLAFAANAWQGLLRVNLAYETTPNQPEREFFQNWIVDERGIPRSVRYIDPDLMSRVWTAIVNLSPNEKRRILRAITQYTDALQHWRPGSELYALSHLYMGVEAITPLVIDREVKHRGLKNRRALEKALRGPPASSWLLRITGYLYRLTGGYIGNRLDGWARLELIFRNDLTAYKTAKSASDKLEHGAAHHEVRTLAASSVVQTAQYLRDAMLNMLALTETDRAALRDRPYAKPASTAGYERQILATITSTEGDIALPDEAYPRVQWEFQLEDFTVQSDGSHKMKVKQIVTPKIRNGATFSPKKVHFAGPGETTHSDVNVTITKAPGGSAPTAAGIIFDMDQPNTGQWLLPVGRLILNINTVTSLGKFWLQKLSTIPAEELEALSFPQTVERIHALFEKANVPVDLRAQCETVWTEVRHLDEMRVILSTARPLPDGLALPDLPDPNGDHRLRVLKDPSTLAEINDRAIAAAKTASELLGKLLTQEAFRQMAKHDSDHP